MFLSIKNLGKIEAADIKIDGITVIAGENDTGKSTVGKTLFSVFNSFYQIDRQIYEITILINRLQSEFSMQINNLDYPEKISEIMFIIKEKEIKIQVADNDRIEVFNNISLNTEVIYIDDPHIMDNLHEIIANIPPKYRNHRDHLRVLINKNKTVSVVDEIIASKKLELIFEKINSICPGEIIKTNTGKFFYREKETGNLIDVVNMSAGLKTFAIIKTLLLKGCLEENGILILDEPEIHLHPKWQLVFAEIIVLLQKEFNTHILINTHSPYFLDSIEVYSRKHGIAGKCRYYLAEVSDKFPEMSRFTDVSDNIEQIYKKLADPLQILEDESYDY